MKKFLTLLGTVGAMHAAQVSGYESPSSSKDYAFNAVRESKECHASLQSINCTYRLGDHLKFSIDGVGEIDAAVTFEFVSPESPYHARFAIKSSCVLIQRKLLNTPYSEAISDMAFVSLRNGKVYRTWPECKESA